MKSFARKQFLDRTFDAEDLDDLAAFWKAVYAARKQKRKEVIAKFEVTEFPRDAGPALCDEVLRRAEELDLTEAAVSLTDPDTLVVDLGTATVLPSVGMELFAGDLFDGLAVKVRFRVIDKPRRGWSLIRGGDAHYMVNLPLELLGELRGGAVLAKVLRRCTVVDSEFHVGNFDSVSDQEEARLITGLDEFRESVNVSSKLSKKVLMSPAGVWFVRLVMRLMYVPILAGPRLFGLISRLAFFTACFTLMGYLIYRMVEHDEWIWILPLILFGWLPVLLFFGFALLEGCIWVNPEAKKLIRHLEGSGPLTPLPPDKSLALDRDPAVRKQSNELLTAGCTHAGDAATTPSVVFDAPIRVFLAGDGATYLLHRCFRASPILNHEVAIWPPSVEIVAHTQFAHGGYVTSKLLGPVGHPDEGERERGPGRLFRSVVGFTDPVEFYRDHLAAVTVFARKNGLSPVRHGSFDDTLRQLEAAGKDDLKELQEKRRSFFDRLRWYLQLPRGRSNSLGIG
jgi:hypothetical protein